MTFGDRSLCPPSGTGARRFLLPGEVFVTETPTLIATVLGSCVAVCLWDTKTSLCGMNHFVLPAGGDGRRAGGRYGDAATSGLIERFLVRGSRIPDLRARVFGGATVLPFGRNGKTIGDENLVVALERLKAHGISVFARRTGGKHGLFIEMYSSTGHVAVRSLGPATGPSPLQPVCHA